MVRISRPAPTSSASVSAVCTIVTARSSRRSPRPALLFGPRALQHLDRVEPRRAQRGHSPATSAATHAEAKAPRQHRPAGGDRIETRNRVAADQLEHPHDSERQRHAERAADDRRAAGSRSRPGGTARPGRRRARCARRTPAAAAARAPAAAPRRCRTRSAAPARPRRAAAAECGGRRDSFRRSATRTCGVMPSKSRSACACRAAMHRSSACA